MGFVTIRNCIFIVGFINQFEVKNYITRIALLLALFMMPLVLVAQEGITVRGKVTTNSKFPILNATVKVKSSGQEFLTDSLGHFALTCMPYDKLIVTANGFLKKRIKNILEGDEIVVDMKLKTGEGALELAIDDGHIREQDRLEMNKVNNTGVDFSVYHSIYDAIRGRIAGLHFIGDDIYLRGNTSIRSGNNPALLVVDGHIVSKIVFSSTPTSQIRSIKVLKGSAASIYGSNGGNGVVEVYTK